MPERCQHCGEPIQIIRYALGPEWTHFDPHASFPTERKGTAWRYCHLTVATPVLDADQAPPTASPDRHGHPDLTCDEAGCER